MQSRTESNLEPSLSPPTPTDEKLMEHAEKMYANAFAEKGLELPTDKPESFPYPVRLNQDRPAGHPTHCQCQLCLFSVVAAVCNRLDTKLEERAEKAENFKKAIYDKHNAITQRVTHLQEEDARHISSFEALKTVLHSIGAALDSLKKRQDELDSKWSIANGRIDNHNRTIAESRADLSGELKALKERLSEIDLRGDDRERNMKDQMDNRAYKTDVTTLDNSLTSAFVWLICLSVIDIIAMIFWLTAVTIRWTGGK